MQGGDDRTWSSFCGVDDDVFVDALRGALEELGIEFRTEDAPAAFMLGTESSTRFHATLADGDEVSIRVYHASGDPLLRMTMSLRAADDPLGGVCVVKTRYPVRAEDEMQRIFAATIARLPSSPAAVEHHPRFRFAPIARWRIKRKWRRWTDGEPGAVRSTEG